MNIAQENVFKEDLHKEARQVRKVLNFSKYTGSVFTGLAACTILGLTFGNSERFIPTTSVCFNPKIVYEPYKDEKALYPKYCEPKKIHLVATSIYDYLKRTDYEFAAKTTVIDHHDNNLKSTKVGMAASCLFGLFGVSCFSYAKKLKGDFKNLLYRLQHYEISENEITTAAAIKQKTLDVESHFYVPPSESEMKIQGLLHAKKVELQMSNDQKTIDENKLASTKALKEIEDLQLGKSKTEVVHAKDLPNIPGVDWFNWDWFRDKSIDEIPHVRVVGQTGTGKSYLISWLLNFYLQGESKVITPKYDDNPKLWGLLEEEKRVFGRPENWGVIKEHLEWMETERKRRNAILGEGIKSEPFNVFFDEWRSIVGQDELKDLAIKTVRDTVTLARAARIRMILAAQGRYSKTFGFRDESDLMENLTTIFLGRFAIEAAENWIFDRKMVSPEGKIEFIEFIKKAGNRAAFIQSSFGDYPCVVPSITIE